MNAYIYIVTAFAGGIGAATRFLLGEWLGFSSERYPWLLLLVNTVGGFAIVVVMHSAEGAWVQILATGLLGGFTTFSAASTTAAEHWQAGRRMYAGFVAVSLFLATIVSACLASLVVAA